MTTTMTASEARLVQSRQEKRRWDGMAVPKEMFDAVGRLEKALKEKSVVKGDDIDLLIKALKAQQFERFFPVLRYGVVPWWVGKVAHGRWLAKQRKQGNPVGTISQAVEGLAQRGGFTTIEMDEYAPGWRTLSRPYVPTRRDFPFSSEGL